MNWCDLCLPANEQAFAEAHRIKIQHFQARDLVALVFRLGLIEPPLQLICLFVRHVFAGQDGVARLLLICALAAVSTLPEEIPPLWASA